MRQLQNVKLNKILNWVGGSGDVGANLYRKWGGGGRKGYLYIFLKWSLLLCAIRKKNLNLYTKVFLYIYFSKWNTRRCLKSVK